MNAETPEMGQIRKRGDIYWIRYYRAGKRHEESTRSNKRGEADRLLKLREGDVAKGVPIAVPPQRTVWVQQN